MIVALTGGTGFLGSHVLDALRDVGHPVRALTRRTQPPREGVEWIAGSLDDRASLERLCTSSSCVVHVAGVVNGSAEAFDTGNRQGTIAMLQAARGQRFVHVSSIAAREPQLSNYGRSKRAAEDAVAGWDGDWRIIRPPAIYGPGDTDNLELFRLAQRGFVPLPPGGRMSVIHAADMARLIVALAGGDARHALFEADDGLPGGWSHADFARAIGHAVGRRRVVLLPLPAVLLRAAAALDERTRGARAKLTADRAAYFCHPDWVIDPVKRPPSALWTPRIATAAGLASTADWYRAQGWL